MKITKMWKLLLITSVAAVMCSGCFGFKDIYSGYKDETKITEAQMETYEKKTKASEQTEPVTTPEETEETEDYSNETYTNNRYFDVTDILSYNQKYFGTVIIHKVSAKKSVTVNASLIAYDQDGNVLGKATDKIILTAGEENYFCYSYSCDVSNAKFDVSANAKENTSYMVGDCDAVEMVKYNTSDNKLYITFKQVKENLGTFAKFKLLLYKGDTLVSQESGYFNVYANNLSGVNSTDVASILAYGLDFDRVEYYFEP